MRIFLGGKMDKINGDWRNALLSIMGTYRAFDDPPLWSTLQSFDNIQYIARWPVHKGLIFGVHDYVGPYLQTLRGYGDSDVDMKYIGEWHGIETEGQHGFISNENYYSLILQLNKQAIKQADLVFIYLNTPDAFGSLTEIGYAHALGKYIHLVTLEKELLDSFEYAKQMSQSQEELYAAPTDDELRVSLLKAISNYGEWRKVNDNKDGLTQAIHSLELIQSWSADPRVRNEATKCLRGLR